ncbi:MAG TPA: secretin N-terminal domain-containing protein, partial [Gallionella sp.]|nr:secretin N-terminal domain-containing protein [Gallionella sp.]
MRRIILLCMLFFVSLPAAANELEIIALKHRSADEVLPIIRPMLDPGAVASGMNYQLFVRTSPRNLEQIRQLLESIDVAPRRLKITVIQDVDSETIARARELSGSLGVGGHARIEVPDRGGRGGLEVEAGRGDDRLTARLSSSRAFENQHKTQQIQVLEGNRALVHTGESVPVPQRQVIRHPWGTEVIEST